MTEPRNVIIDPRIVVVGYLSYSLEILVGHYPVPSKVSQLR